MIKLFQDILSHHKAQENIQHFWRRSKGKFVDTPTSLTVVSRINFVSYILGKNHVSLKMSGKPWKWLRIGLFQWVDDVCCLSFWIIKTVFQFCSKVFFFCYAWKLIKRTMFLKWIYCQLYLHYFCFMSLNLIKRVR